LDQKIKEQIEVADWNDITRKLTVYAASRVRYVFRIKNNYVTLPMGASIETVVQESVRKLLDGTRVWNPDRVDLLGFLMGIVRSEISHLAGLKDTQQANNCLSPEEIENFQGDSFDPEQLLEEKEEARVIYEAYQELINQAESNPEYGAIALCLMSGVSKAADIAKETGIEIKKVYSLKRNWQKDFEKILREVLAKAN
jgi:hypothetical protein